MNNSAPPARRRRPLHQTLFGQISLAFFFVILLLGLGQYFFLSWIHQRADDVVLQFEMWSVSEAYANAIRAHSAEGLPGIQNTVFELNRANPFVDAYLVNDDGEILFSFSEVEPETNTTPIRKIDMGPVRDFLTPNATQRAPFYGTEPTKLGSRVIFSAARFELEGKPVVLYAVLRGNRHWNEFKLYAENYLARYFSISSIVSIVVTILVAVLIFYVLSRRVTKTIAAMRAFRDGELSSRVRLDAQDEIGELASTFDEMADRIVQSVEELENRDTLRRELIATISHDLRGPLSNIKAHLELNELKAEPDRTDPAETLEVIKRNADQLGALLTQLFELATLEAREASAEMEEHMLKPLFDDLLISYGPTAKDSGVRLVSEVADPRLAVYGDFTMLGRIVGNLVENALRFTKPGGRIVLSATPAGELVRIAVTDTGTGIPESELPKIFERFYQGERGKQHSATSGLGLAIVRRLVELQGSKVEVKSALDVGTEFSFSLRSVAAH